MKNRWIIKGVAVPIIVALIGACASKANSNDSSSITEKRTEASKEPTTEQPTTEQPTTEEPTTGEPTTEEQKTKRNDVKTDLTDVNIIKGEEDFLDDNNGDQDNMGKDRKYRIWSYSDGRKATYVLDQKYKTLTGEIALISGGLEGEDEDEAAAWLHFYSVDENERIADLGVSEKLKPGIRPKSINIDVEGVKELEVVAYTNSDDTYILTDGLFLSK